MKITEEPKKLAVGLGVVRVKLEMMESWNKEVTDADQKGDATLLQVFWAKDDLNKLYLKRNELQGRFRKVESESRHRLIHLT